MRFSPRSSFARQLALLIAFTLSVLLAQAAAPIRAFDVPAGEAAVTLKQAAKQGQVEIVFPAKLVQGVTTAAVKGEFTARAALNRMLAGTDLVLVTDEKSGALTVSRLPRDEKNDSSRPAEAAAANGSTSVKIRDGTVQLDAYEVTERRVDGLNNKGLLQGGPDAPLYHDVVTRADIERLGVTSLEELFRLIPQTSSPETGLQAFATNAQTVGGVSLRTSTMGLRGFDSTQTVILINGRALPRSGTNAGADLSRIPLAAIERVEILPYAGSAIYGAGAIGGAINIILRKEYAGKDLTTYVGTSTDGGATEFRVTYVDGRRFNSGRTNLTLTFSYQHREPLLGNDREYLAEAFRRYGPNSAVRLPGSGISAFEAYIAPAFAGVPALIVVSNSAPVSTDLGIPGAAGVRFAVVPAGTTAAQSFLLTPGAFAATAGRPSLNPRFGRSVLYEPLDAYSLNAQVEHEFIKDRLSAYGEFTIGYNRKDYSFPQGLSVTLSATDPMNPFRTGVTPGFVGRPVTVYFDTPDVPEPSVLAESEAARAVVGLKGKFASRWEWSADATIDYAHSTSSSNNPTTTLAALSALSGGTGAAPAATRRAIYPILADHGAYPLSAADAATYLPSIRFTGSHGLLYEGNSRLVGDVITLPAGPLRASLVGKYQKWEYEVGGAAQRTDAYAQLTTGAPFVDVPSSNDSNRTIRQGGAELSIPVIGKSWRPIPIESFDVQASTSYEANITSGTNASSGLPFTNTKNAHSSVVAGKLQLVRDLALRASYSEGFYPPNWTNLSSPQRVTVTAGNVPDPKRGLTTQGVSFNVLSGGNPDLRPETANSENFGIILTPRFAPGFTLSVDYWKIRKIDAITTIIYLDAIQKPDLYGFAVTRAAPTADEQAKGWLGLITDIDSRSINVAQTETEGVDSRLRYTRPAGALGLFTFNANATFTNRFQLKTSPTANAVNTAGAGGVVRWRGLASVTWNRARWSATLTGRYVGHYSASSTAPSSAYPNATGLDGGRIPAYLHWDIQGSYEIPARAGQGRWRDWVSATKWTVGVNNFLNEKPSFVTNGASFYNTFDDPRQRFVYLSIKKSL